MAVNQFTLSAILIALSWFSSINAAGYEDVWNSCPGTIPASSTLRTFNSQCYEFIRTERYWDVAQRDCQSRGGNLIQIRDLATQSFVINTLAKLQWNRNGMWLGAHDLSREGHWNWVTGDKVAWSNWEAGQPSCYVPALKLFCAEDCAVLRINSGGKWHDYRCHSAGFTYTYICQYDMLTTRSAIHKQTTIKDIIQPGKVSKQNGSVFTTGATENQAEAISEQTVEVTAILPGESSTDAILTETVDVNASIVTDGSENATTEQVTKDNVTMEYIDVEQNITISNREKDFVEIHTSYPKEESTHIIIGENDLFDNDHIDGNYDYNLLPEVRAAQTGKSSTDGAPKSLIGPIVGVLMGTFIFAGLLVAAVFFYRKRTKSDYDSWAVGFDNPNYDNPVSPENSPEGNVSEVVYEECSRVAVFPPEDYGVCDDSCRNDMRSGGCPPDVCAVSIPRPCKDNHYVSMGFPLTEHSANGNISNSAQTSQKQTS